LHFIRNEVEFEKVKIVKISYEDNPINVFKKSLPISKFKYYLNLINFSFKDKGEE